MSLQVSDTPDSAPQNLYEDDPTHEHLTDDDLKLTADGVLSNWCNTADSFDDMKLKPELLRGIFSYGYEHPSAIQKSVIPAIVSGRDVIAQSQSGTGKTVSFCVGALQRLEIVEPISDETVGERTSAVLDIICEIHQGNTIFEESITIIVSSYLKDLHHADNHPQVLVISPTRQLAIYTNTVCEALGSHMTGLRSVGFAGSLKPDWRKRFTKTLEGGIHVLFGTPWRINQLINRDMHPMDSIKLFILDEADELLKRGYQHQIYNIFGAVPSDAQVCIFSATMCPEVLTVAKKCMRNPIRVLCKREEDFFKSILSQNLYLSTQKIHVLETWEKSRTGTRRKFLLEQLCRSNGEFVHKIHS